MIKILFIINRIIEHVNIIPREVETLISKRRHKHTVHYENLKFCYKNFLIIGFNVRWVLNNSYCDCSYQHN